jgi:hypothetical protein
LAGQRKALAKEIDRRLQQRAFDLAAILFPRQLAAVTDPARWKAYLCSRQSGKSTADCVELLHNAVVGAPGTDAVFVAPTLGQARKIIWRDLLAYNDRYQLGGEPNATSYTLTFPNGSTIQLRGVQDRADIEWFRGQRFSLVVIDEAQSIGAHLRELLWDVLRATLMKHHGRAVLTGTVGLVSAGYWYEVTNGLIPDWKVHSWSILDNPHIPDAAAEMADFARQLGGENHPKFQREMLCRWVRDANQLVYQIDADRNTYVALPDGKPDGCVLGVDLGSRDATSLVVIVWWDGDPCLYVADEAAQTGFDLEDVRQAIEKRIERWNPDRIVIDEGGLGLMMADTLRRRHALPVEPAQKMAAGGVIGQMDMLSTDLIRGRLKCPPRSRFLDAASALQWDQEARARGERRLGGHEPDVCAALRYAWFVAQQLHLWEPPALVHDRRARLIAEMEARALLVQEEPGDWMGRDLAELGY